MVKLVEFGWLEKRRREFSITLDIEENIAHLEYEKHPGDAEGDEGQLHEGENPGLSKFYDNYQKLVGWSEGFRENEGAALKN